MTLQGVCSAWGSKCPPPSPEGQLSGGVTENSLSVMSELVCWSKYCRWFPEATSLPPPPQITVGSLSDPFPSPWAFFCWGIGKKLSSLQTGPPLGNIRHMTTNDKTTSGLFLLGP